MPSLPTTLTQDNKPRPNSSTLKDYIEQLQKENVALKKLLADKNKIIDISGAELQKLRMTLQKMQQQNLHLAQSNSQLLAETECGLYKTENEYDYNNSLHWRQNRYMEVKMESSHGSVQQTRPYCHAS